MVQSRVELTITTFGTLLIAGADAREYALVKEVLPMLPLLDCIAQCMHVCTVFGNSPITAPNHAIVTAMTHGLSHPSPCTLACLSAGTATEPHVHVLPRSHS